MGDGGREDSCPDFGLGKFIFCSYDGANIRGGKFFQYFINIICISKDFLLFNYVFFCSQFRVKPWIMSNIPSFEFFQVQLLLNHLLLLLSHCSRNMEANNVEHFSNHGAVDISIYGVNIQRGDIVNLQIHIENYL